MVDELTELNKVRVSLKKRRNLLIPVWLGIPFLSIFLTLSQKLDNPTLIILGLLITSGIYALSIGAPFKKIKGKVKKAILEEFMKSFHPEMSFSYQQTGANGKNIAKQANLVRFTSGHEEDVLVGNHLGANFYLSELNLSKKSGKSRRTVFSGILFELTIPGKDFPEAEIRSGTGAGFTLSNLVGKVNYNENFNFYYNTNDHQKFEEELGPLFPFIQHLSASNGGLKIRTEKNRIVIMMDSDMKFLDTPRFGLGKSFFNKEYNQELSQQLNTLFFIVESFATNLEKSEIVERLELKVLQTINQAIKT